MKAAPSKGATPGPWHLHDMERFTVCGPDHLAIALCKAKSRTPAENDANTKLIARAPDMLELLRDFVMARRLTPENWGALYGRVEKLLSELDGLPGE